MSFEKEHCVCNEQNRRKIRTTYNVSIGYMRIWQYYKDLFKKKDDISNLFIYCKN